MGDKGGMMKRFVDLRGARVYGRFAWYDTIVDEFEVHGGAQTWCDWSEFLADYKGNELERYAALTPEWAHIPEPEAD